MSPKVKLFVFAILLCVGCWFLVGIKASAHDGPVPAWALGIIGKDFSHMRVAYESESSCETANAQERQGLDQVLVRNHGP
jgi:hypothetical protein